MVDLDIRPAQLSDYTKLSAFLNYHSHIHRHLDWKSPLDWLGYQPFLLAENGGEIEAVFASPPDPPQVAWIRIFAASNRVSSQRAWELLSQQAISLLQKEDQKPHLVALALHDWFEEILINNHFISLQKIIVLEWAGKLPTEIPLSTEISIRKMVKEDLPVVRNLDNIAFEPLWNNSIESLTLAFDQSSSSEVAMKDNHIIGYQISTAIPFNGHLARLAVDPAYQGQNIGYNLVYNMLLEYKKLGIWRVTVNTQDNNLASLSLYDKIGFRKTGEVFPVYEYPEIQ
jgi:ribosomal protein S18 acetylase RimI-like enzyme